MKSRDDALLLTAASSPKMLSRVAVTSAARRRPLLWQLGGESSTPKMSLAAPPGGWI